MKSFPLHLLGKWLAGLSCIVLAPAGSQMLWAQTVSTGRFPLLAATVASAIHDAGLQVSAEQVKLPSSLSSGSASPTLQVTAAELLPGGGLRVRMACKVARECLPFFALIEASAPGAGLAEVASLHMVAAPFPSAQHELSAVRQEVTVRAGTHTTLLIENAHMRISLPVITLDSGAVGSEVRVSSLDRKTTYRGFIEGPQIVRGALP